MEMFWKFFFLSKLYQLFWNLLQLLVLKLLAMCPKTAKSILVSWTRLDFSVISAFFVTENFLLDLLTLKATEWGSYNKKAPTLLKEKNDLKIVLLFIKGEKMRKNYFPLKETMLSSLYLFIMKHHCLILANTNLF